MTRMKAYPGCRQIGEEQGCDRGTTEIVQREPQEVAPPDPEGRGPLLERDGHCDEPAV